MRNARSAILAFLLFAITPVLAFGQAAPARDPGKDAAIEHRANRTLIDETLPADKDVEAAIAPYTAKVRSLDVVIGTLQTELKKETIGAGTLGNFVIDGLRAQASARLGRPIVLAVINSGGLRKNTIAPGELRASDIFELLPFENELILIDLKGEQLLKLLNVVISNREVQSGARLKYRQTDSGRELVSARLLVNGKEQKIDPKKTYSVLTIDYLIQLASGRYTILQQGKNMRPLHLTMRDALIDYVKSETAAGRAINVRLDGRFVSVRPEASSATEQK